MARGEQCRCRDQGALLGVVRSRKDLPYRRAVRTSRIHGAHFVPVQGLVLPKRIGREREQA